MSMGVYIKGMEMPKSCWDCEVGGAKQMDNATCPFYSMEYWEQENYQDKIADGCPLVPVPERGRLGDLDALKETIDSLIEKHLHGCTKSTWDFVCELRSIISDAPTIIPAEEGET